MAVSQIGLDAKFYTDDQGAGVGTWALIDFVGDVTVNQTRNTVARKDRMSDFELMHVGQRVVSIDVTLTFEAADANYEEVRDAYTGGTDIGVAAMHTLIATSGSEGLQFDAKVSNFTRNEALEGVIAFDVTFVPSAESTFTPVYTEVV